MRGKKEWGREGRGKLGEILDWGVLAVKINF